MVGGSDDFSHVVYHSNDNHTAEPDSPPPGDFGKLYEFVVEGPDCGPGSPGGGVVGLLVELNSAIG